MKIALCQINPVIGDIGGNKAKIEEGYSRGVKDGADLVIFPELALCGYPPQDLIEKKEFRQAVQIAAKELASITGKTLLPNYDIFDEVRYFESAKEVFVHKFKDEVLGISICEDIWNDADYWKQRRYHTDPVQCIVDKGATILLNISASPYAYGRREERREMLSVLTKVDNVPLAYVCCVGAQTDLIFDGASMCFNSNGELQLLGKCYEEDYFIFDTKLNYESIKNVESSMEEEILQSLILGLKDYSVKTGFKKALIGLSGGIDSAIVTYIAVQAFGAENVHVIMMPSKYSSSGSVSDSEKLIRNLGISSDKISVQPAFDNVLELMKPIFGDKPEDITEENLQSRLRGVYLMAYSNKFGSLVCTTGNKSEMAVGYATLYGDMNGALAVIGDVYKTEVYKIAKYINRNGEIIPEAIITKPPSAELRPDQTDQDSLPEYETLDRILKMYLEEYKEYNEIVKEIKDEETVKKILRLVDLNEFKRKQAAPVLRVSTKAFGYGRRFPIVQGWRR